MAELSEAWKPFVKPERAKLADDLVTASNDLAAVAKSAGKKSADIHEAVQGVRAVCGECHKGYKSKEESK
jgi:cytochrome c556